MKVIFLFRHAKTVPIGADGNDHIRKLTPEGEAAASQIGEQLVIAKRLPDFVICSDAERAQQTALLAMAPMDRTNRVIPLAALYTGGTENVLALLAGRPENSIMVVGHNPCMEECAELFSGSIVHMRPGFCLWLKFDITKWEMLYSNPIAIEHKLYKPAE
jgi:phosphohistidine phosphatase